MGESDRQFNAKLIDDYYLFRDMLKMAKKANNIELVQLIEVQMEKIRLKLQPLKLPEETD